MPRPSTVVLSLTGLLACSVLAVSVLSGLLTDMHAPRLDANHALVAHLGLTDLALFTEARYTRHPSQADLHSAFQDHPGAFEHFPSGSLIVPPAHLIHSSISSAPSSHESVAGKTAASD